MPLNDDLYHPVDKLDEGAGGKLLEYAHWPAADEDQAISEDQLVPVRGSEAAIVARGRVMVEELDGASRS